MLGNTGLMDDWQILSKSIEKKKNKCQNMFVALKKCNKGATWCSRRTIYLSTFFSC